MSNEIIETRNSKVWLEDGIIRQTLKPQVEVKLAEMKEIVAARKKAGQNKKRPYFNDISNIKSINREARNYGTSEEVAKTISAMALFVKTPLSSMIGNFFLGLNKPPYPTKLFTNEKKALEWLKGFLSK